MARYNRDWITACAEATPGKYVPDLFRKWTALVAVGAAMRRQVWYEHGDWKCRPNLYVALVAPPGHGKGVALTLPFDLVYLNITEPVIDGQALTDTSTYKRYLPDDWDLPCHMLSGRVTYEKLCRVMPKLTKMVDGAGVERYPDSSLLIKTSEFGVFMTRSDKNLQMLLTEGWDSGRVHEYFTKNMGDDVIHGPTLTWMAAATPSEFIEHMPANAADQGLLSRIIPVVQMDAPNVMEIKVDQFDKELVDVLSTDLGKIAALRGEFVFSKECAEELVKPWLAGGQEPRPTDPMMKEYAGRRFSHLLKTSMCFSAGRRDTKVIEAGDWIDATTLLFETEQYMPRMLRRFGMSDNGKLADDLVEFVRRSSKPVTAHQLSRTAMRMAKSFGDLGAVVDILIENGTLKDTKGVLTVGETT